MATFTNVEREGNNKLTFTINNAELSIVNACRRIIIAEIPTVAFYFDASDVEHSDIKIKKNSCALHNEFLAHRISLVPLCFDENEINDFDASKYKFVLSKENNTLDLVNVTTDDFDILDDAGKKYPIDVKNKILPANAITKDHILLTKLKPNLYDEVTPPRGEGINIECFPTLGTATKHARWSPVSQCAYQNSIDEQLAAKRFDEVVHDFEAEQGRKVSQKEKDQLKQRFDSLEVYRCFMKNKYDEANTFDFKIESECRMRPAYLFLKSIKILSSKITNFIDNITNMREDAVKVTALTGVDNFYQVEVKNESHTLMNVLQSLMYNICFRERKSDKNPLDYIGYYQPHPLDEIMVLKLRFKTLEDVTINKAYVTSTLVELANEIRDRVNDYAKEWLAITFADLKDIKEVVDYKDSM